ncbi:MtrB/PioB family outer membrane beta-barrel protein [Paucibacter sp. PLA-PC-4]|uniref:MtrB/PioB family outer membrane beta-barrel protein n=1 Tax=Paucibacter sp. PLA-PC-4 TaxID=2993655 RepID=UPI00224B48D2|nr:MtrB/PioB family outer membrane beta-barrel protein [Paucibacter sp. PLA-PC-4]MCX2863593.1 MtrB/PioB family outer membrane beta-barrel protein [Paucibacter sp. PLA-PC-4]
MNMAQHRYTLLTASLLCALPAVAQQSPYYLGASLGVTHVSNIYRNTPGQPTNDDNVTTATLLAGLDQRIGRQRLFGDASIRANHYENNRSLRNNGYALNAGVDWQTIERLSGQLSVNSNRSLAQFNPGNGAPNITKKNIEQTDQARASVRYGLVSLLSLEGSLTHRRRDYSASEYDRYDYSQNTVSLGLTWRPSSALSLGVAGRYSDGKYPRFRTVATGFEADEYTRKDIDLTGTWVASGASTLAGRLSFGKRDASQATSRDFSGGTGSISWKWQPSAKLLINSNLMRDSGDETSFLAIGSIGGISSDYSRITTSASVNASYELTGKIVLDAGLNFADRDLTDSFGTNTVKSGDKSTSLSFGGRWAVTRSATVGCQLNRDKRTGLSTLSTPYSANSYGCYAQMMVR